MSKKLFGTDGIRGTANTFPITPEIALKFGMAAGLYFKNDERRHRVVIGKDTRLSGYMIENALTSGFAAMGMDVILVGPMPTPAVAMLIKSLKADLGVVISASHNPYQDNGLKLFDARGLKLDDAVELQIENLILTHDFNKSLVAPDQLGRAKRLDDAPGRYVEHVKRSFPKGLSLEGLRIVVDCANGASYHLAPDIFWELGADVIKIGTEPNGFNINLNCGSTAPQALQQKVIETRADIGIAFDGDADRLLIVDEAGKVIDGDHLIAMIATEMQQENTLRGGGVVVTHMTNMAFDEYMSKIGLATHRVDIGDRYVSQKMLETGCNLGGEQSGHIVISDYATTGDGMVAALQVLALMVRSKEPLRKLSGLYEPFPQVTNNIKFTGSNPMDDPKLVKGLEELKNREKENCRFLIRKSGTEKLIRVLVEGRDRAKISELMHEASQLISNIR